MKKTIFSVLFLAISLLGFSQPRIEQLFDEGWKFHKGDVNGAEAVAFKDNSWRTLNLPHDWSIEPLENQKEGEVVGPFDKNSTGTTATAYTIGGIGWYRKHFTLEKDYAQVILNFDGVYMNAEVWVNGKKAFSHPYGYTAFQVDLTQYLNKAGKENVVAVKVNNDGQNSRWYSGSGIYRHVHLIQKNAVNIDHNGIFITTDRISPFGSTIKLVANLSNLNKKMVSAHLLTTIFNPAGEVVRTIKSDAQDIFSKAEFTQSINITDAQLWSVDTPNMYSAQVEVIVNNETVDVATTPFGIRTISVNATEGLLINGESVLLKGGCLHHDNGFLGSATIDRAEERKVELMKAYGYNAIRTAHNPVSRQFLDACDRIGILVVDEIFDMWQRDKNPQDYHLYFDEWWQYDLASTVLRDRNHPSVIIWSIGNEIKERIDPSGHEIRKNLVAAVKELDSTRPVTEGICTFWDLPGTDWSTTEPVFAALDIASYNYNWKQYDPDHAAHPNRVMMSTETYPNEVFENWMQVSKNPWVIGDFVWTGMDHIGESGVGNSFWSDGSRRYAGGLQRWPWFVNYSGDIDICGNKKPQLILKDVVWGNSNLEIAVHTPAPEEGLVELVTGWGWPQEIQSWSWAGHEGKLMDVRVFSRYPRIRLELNGRVIDEQVCGEAVKDVAAFKVPYEPGVLRAIAVVNGVDVASEELVTVGKPAKVKLTADRKNIKASINDLSYVKVEIVDANGNLIPDAIIPVDLKVSGQGYLAGSGNACPTDQESFNSNIVKTYYGKALAILRPNANGEEGSIVLEASASGLESSLIEIIIQ